MFTSCFLIWLTGVREETSIVDGVLIEYFANPVRQIRHYFEKEFKQNKRSTARIITIGKVLFDKAVIINELKREALEYMKKPFEKPDEIW